MNRSAKQEGQGRTLQRIGWMVLIWAGSVAALGVFAMGMRLVMSLAGMTR